MRWAQPLTVMGGLDPATHASTTGCRFKPRNDGKAKLSVNGSGRLHHAVCTKREACSSRPGMLPIRPRAYRPKHDDKIMKSCPTPPAEVARNRKPQE